MYTEQNNNFYWYTARGDSPSGPSYIPRAVEKQQIASAVIVPPSIKLPEEICYKYAGQSDTMTKIL